MLKKEINVHTIRGFCSLMGISEATYFKWKKQGRAPKTMKVGRRVFITTAAIHEWQKKMEEENGV